MAAAWWAGDDNATTGGAGTSVATPSISMVGAPADSYAIATLRILTASTDPAVTWNTIPMTLVGSVVNVAGSNYTEYTYELDAPTTGVVAGSWAGSSHGWISGQVGTGVTGIRASSFTTAAGQAAGTAQTLNVTTVAGDLVFSCIVSSGNITATGNGLTSAYTPTVNNNTRLYSGYATADDTSYPAGWTLSGTGEYFEHSALALAAAASGPTINTQPSNVTAAVTPSVAATPTIAATTSGGSLSYQWQVDDGGGYDNVSNGGIYANATTAALTITPTATTQNGYLYRCAVSDDNGTTNTNASTLTVVQGAVISGGATTDGSGAASATLTPTLALDSYAGATGTGATGGWFLRVTRTCLGLTQVVSVQPKA